MSTPTAKHNDEELREAVRRLKNLLPHDELTRQDKLDLNTVLASLEAARLKIEHNEREHFSCFRCNDGYTPLYCLNCAEKSIRAATSAEGEAK